MLAQPCEVNSSRVVATSRLGLHIPCLALPAKKPADCGLADAKQLCGLGVRSAALGLVRLDYSPPKIDRELSHFYV